MQEMEHCIRNCDEMRAADCKIWRKAPKGDFRHAEPPLSKGGFYALMNVPHREVMTVFLDTSFLKNDELQLVLRKTTDENPKKIGSLLTILPSAIRPGRKWDLVNCESDIMAKHIWAATSAIRYTNASADTTIPARPAFFYWNWHAGTIWNMFSLPVTPKISLPGATANMPVDSYWKSHKFRRTAICISGVCGKNVFIESIFCNPEKENLCATISLPWKV